MLFSKLRDIELPKAVQLRSFDRLPVQPGAGRINGKKFEEFSFPMQRQSVLRERDLEVLWMFRQEVGCI